MKVLITREIPRAGIDLLKKHPDIEIDMRKGAPLSSEELIEGLKDADALIPVIPDKITEEIISSAKDLKIIAAYSVGFDHIDISTATKNKVYVSNTPGNLTESVAEHAMALMISVARNIVSADKFTRGGEYKFWDPMIFLGPVLQNKTLGIVGFGRIGQHLAKIAKGGFNMRVLYTDTQQNEKAELETGAMYVGMDELLENSDFISLHVPLLPSTKHLIDERSLKKMKPSCYLINTSRGPVIDEDALAISLKEGRIQGAGIDVFEEEPNIFDGLKELDNVVLTPHIGSATREARIEMARMAASNVIDVLIDKKAPTNLVNKELI